jgi:hypothetical protein
MRFAKCDFCTARPKPADKMRETVIDFNAYDICPDCLAKREAELKGKGRQSVAGSMKRFGDAAQSAADSIARLPKPPQHVEVTIEAEDTSADKGNGISREVAKRMQKAAIRAGKVWQ